MHILEIPIALQFFRLPPRSKLHPALPCPQHLQSSQKRACKWNFKWQRPASTSLPGKQQVTLKKQTEMSKTGTLAREVLFPSVELWSPLWGTMVLSFTLSEILSISQQYLFCEIRFHTTGMRSFHHPPPTEGIWLHSLKKNPKQTPKNNAHHNFFLSS